MIYLRNCDPNNPFFKLLKFRIKKNKLNKNLMHRRKNPMNKKVLDSPFTSTYRFSEP